jgi:hypothetical protein
MIRAPVGIFMLFKGRGLELGRALSCLADKAYVYLDSDILNPFQ